MPSPNLIASILARQTSRIRIAVVGNALPLYDPPTRVAEEFAMIDVISGGRLIAGMVVGGGPEYYSFSVNPAHARERFQEAHDLITKAWTTPGPFEWVSKHYRILDHPTAAVGCAVSHGDEIGIGRESRILGGRRLHPDGSCGVKRGGEPDRPAVGVYPRHSGGAGTGSASGPTRHAHAGPFPFDQRHSAGRCGRLQPGALPDVPEILRCRTPAPCRSEGS